MTEPDDHASEAARTQRLKNAEEGPTKEPDWTHGLKRLYDSVLEEPMPDSFKDLLSKLDDDARR